MGSVARLDFIGSDLQRFAALNIGRYEQGCRQIVETFAGLAWPFCVVEKRVPA
jgi:hypothetical protein